MPFTLADPLLSPRDVASLPGLDDAVSDPAATLVELGAWLLATRDAPLACITLDPARRPGGSSPLVVWDRSFTARPDLATARRDEPQIAAIVKGMTRAADDLWRALLPRWPAYAVPRGLGVVTDGTGLAFSPDDPCPLVPGWLSRQSRGRAGLVEIVRFAEAGAWSLLTAPVASRGSH